MANAEAFAQKSYAVRAKVGAIIVKNGNIIAFGYNGMPSGFDNTCEHTVNVSEPSDLRMSNDAEELAQPYSKLKTNPEVLHAESNALMKLARSGGVGSEGADIYVTYSPCLECSKLIIQAGIARVFFKVMIS